MPVMDPFAPFCSFCTKNLCFVMRPAVPPQCRDRGGEVQSLLLLGLGCVMGIFRRQDSLWGNAPRVIELTLILPHVLAMGAVTHWEGATRSISHSFAIHPVLMHPPRMLQSIITLFLPVEEGRQMAEDDRERAAFSWLLEQGCDI